MTTTTDFTLKTDRLVLRPFERDDLDHVLSYYSLPEVQRYLEWKARDKTEAKAAFEAMRKQKRLTRPGEILTLAIARKSDSAVIGHVSLRWADATAGQGEIRFAIAPAFRRKGYCKEAISAVMNHAFNEFRLHRIFAVTAGSNEASSRLLKGLGMRLEAHYREHALFQGEWDEELHYAILSREWVRGNKVQELRRHKVA
ncbi:MAG TPA: GNAT family protein [Devosia sp.]|jgi:RimJ/RimL family protein N-acetyltransferase|nr:GNAT family protein [Devosia sp.]